MTVPQMLYHCSRLTISPIDSFLTSSYDTAQLRQPIENILVFMTLNLHTGPFSIEIYVSL